MGLWAHIFVYKHSAPMYIYMSRHRFETQMCYMSFLFFDDDDDYFLYVVT
jgi:hypothetical protein